MSRTGNMTTEEMEAARVAQIDQNMVVRVLHTREDLVHAVRFRKEPTASKLANQQFVKDWYVDSVHFCLLLHQCMLLFKCLIILFETSGSISRHHASLSASNILTALHPADHQNTNLARGFTEPSLK